MFCKKNRIRLTPAPSQSPKINGAKIIGVRPGSPVLFKIPVTGITPLSYRADNLPEGLSLDFQTGIINGKIETRGEFIVELTVTNEWGSDSRFLTIKIGDEISLTPPMGWNSWYCHSELISEQAIRDTADAFVSKGLVNHGWTYVNIDDCWQGVRGGEEMAIQPNERFEDMKGMCEYVHSMGLKVGIYSTPWMGTYAGFTGGSAPNEKGDYSEHYLPEEKRLQRHQFFGRYPSSLKKGLNNVGQWFFDRDVRQWADWGFDYVKLDWNPNDVLTTARMNADLKRCDRDMVVSLSNSAPYEEAEELSEHSNCWRTTGDILDWWWSVSKIGFSQISWQHLTRPGHWNDPDMLQVGNIGTPNRKNSSFKPTHLSPQEQYSQMSLWSLLSAPLLLSCDIDSLDDFTLGLLTNDEVIDVNQDPLGKPAFRVTDGWFRQVLVKPLEDGSFAVGLFNRGAVGMKISVKWDDLGLSGEQNVRDLWRQQDLGSYDSLFTSRVNRHGVVLLKISGR
jgi:alpha-galactosidase